MRLPWGQFLKRFSALPLSLFVLVTLSFLMVHVLPGDPARAIAGQYSAPSVLNQIRHQLGLDKPLISQYGSYLDDLVHGNLGTSYRSQTSVGHEIFSRLPGDIELIAASVIVAVVVGLGLGFVGAYWESRLPDRLSRVAVSIQQSLPDFVIGLLLIYFLFFRASVFPAPLGQLSMTAVPPAKITGMVVVDSALHGDWSTFADAMEHLVLPAVSLGFILAAIFAKVSRSALSTALRSPQTEFARACGMRERTIIYYATTVARTPFLTYLAIVVGTALGGVAIIEQVFSWNGAAQWGVAAIFSSDLPSVQGFIIVLGTAAILIYALLDVVVMLLDPRIRVAS